MKKVFKFLLIIVVAVIAISLIAISSFALSMVYMRYTQQIDNTDTNGIFGETFKKKEKEPITVLIIGVNETLSDFIMVAKYDPATGNTSLLSVPRDTKYTGVNGPDTAYSKINAIYQGSKIEKLKNTIEKMLDINIDYYIIFDKKALWKVVDALGGVNVDVGTKHLKYSDPVQDLYIDLQPGMQKLDGKKAEQYVRFRRYVNGDIGRISAQQNFIKAFINECLKVSNVPKLPGIAKIGIESVKTDITLDKILYYLEDVATFDTTKMKVETLPGEARNMSGVSFYIWNEKKSKVLVDEMYKGIITENKNIEE